MVLTETEKEVCLYIGWRVEGLHLKVDTEKIANNKFWIYNTLIMKQCLITITSIIILYLTFFFIMDSMFGDAKSVCLESGWCKEGLSINVDKDKTIIISEQTCTENRGIWHNDSKYCSF